jgi:glycyl-tRNA synthetase
VTVLQALKKQMEALKFEASAGDRAEAAARDGFETLLKRKCFVIPSFEIYGGVKGLFDFGPPGCALLENIKNLWRSHFVLQEDMLEIACTTMTPENVLKVSGHVEKFSDFMCKDIKTGDFHRADKILEDACGALLKEVGITAEKKAELLKTQSDAEAYTAAELGAALQRLEVKAPDTGNELSAPYPFNLMFKTSIGPSGASIGYLRPETAQGMFLNFKRLLEYNRGQLPFASAQIGLAFRNEISPRSALLRVREFTLAEIEHFVNPEDKSHASFSRVTDTNMRLLAADQQGIGSDGVEMLIGAAVEAGIVGNETIAYFMARTHQFLIKIGVDGSKLRFRQHKADEMAHYANDCWDAEIHTSYGWVECVGHADRSCFDLKVHAESTKADLMAQQVSQRFRLFHVFSFFFFFFFV